MKHRIYITGCLLLCLLLGISAFFSADGNSLSEMRDVSEFPQFLNDDKTLNENFDSEISDYIAVRMPVRQAFLNAKAFVMEKLFFTSAAQDDVIVGKNGWYYFNETTDEYIGADLLSERSVANIVDTLEQMQNYCNANSAAFVFTVAPNKNFLYDENMPSRYIKSDENNYTALNRLLKDSNVNFVDLSDLDECSDTPLYYATDSHWNTEGAIIVYDKILDSINKDHLDFSETDRKTAEKKGDLTKMLYPDSDLTETEYIPDYNFSFSYASRMKTEEDIIIRTANPAGTGALLMFRDSFTNALLPFMAENFGSATFTRAVPCDLTEIAYNRYDTVIYEIVQRNLENIISFSPVMAAESVTKNFETDKIIEDSCNAFMREKNEELTHIYGEINSSLLDTDSRIYIRITQDNESSVYRCFNIYERDLFEDSLCKDNGFSVYINAENISENADISIIIESSDKICELKTNL